MIVTCAEHLNKSMQRLAKREDIPGGRIDEAPVYLKRTEPPVLISRAIESHERTFVCLPHYEADETEQEQKPSQFGIRE